eukprot:CAMPEP_0117056290 /NCGR_PEP_ID=MMETSP0472-20121206/39045_1 /TAXON_ID=693140 ORGANISM="Tiarina fusus, Strain LIS" /NCGR_SAMPLE_ID=MMETSP0472 /ASSEMBLY_ACC=CAM_ASM_000603 /LENGTH=134 /DNA_ID=CAMNT_0004772661 /DNA_START=24 /DNA_END=425 /DNA_ORIENTATION=-
MPEEDDQPPLELHSIPKQSDDVFRQLLGVKEEMMKLIEGKLYHGTSPKCLTLKKHAYVTNRGKMEAAFEAHACIALAVLQCVEPHRFRLFLSPSCVEFVVAVDLEAKQQHVTLRGPRAAEVAVKLWGGDVTSCW